jgi:hypothetical protein
VATAPPSFVLDRSPRAAWTDLATAADTAADTAPAPLSFGGAPVAREASPDAVFL